MVCLWLNHNIWFKKGIVQKIFKQKMTINIIQKIEEENFILSICIKVRYYDNLNGIDNLTNKSQ